MNNIIKNPSKVHRNRSLKNYLIYDIYDRFLMKYAPLYKGTIYDLGCGESPYREFLLQFADQYVGIDWPESLHSTKEDIQADLNNPLPIEAELADSIFSISVLEHLYQPQVMFNEAFRILKPNGYIVLQVPWQWLVHEEPHDYFRYSPYALKLMCETAGFEEITIEPQSGFFTMWILKFNYFSNRFVRGPRLTRLVVKACLSPLWFLGQLVAPLLDKLDKNWAAEASGYFITAKKSG